MRARSHLVYWRGVFHFDSPSPLCVRGPLFARPAVPAHPGGHTEQMSLLLPLAHVAHWLWVLYLPPILIVLVSIVKTTLSERRRKRED